MFDFGRVPQGKPVRITRHCRRPISRAFAKTASLFVVSMIFFKPLAKFLLLCGAIGLLVASACPTADPFPPPPMTAPSFTLIEATGTKYGGEYQCAVHLQWKLGNSDSLPVKEFTILKKSPSDSAFGVMHLGSGIPDSIFDVYDVPIISDLPHNQLGGSPFSCVKYRVFAVDSFGRSGDTSAIDSILLTWTPTLKYPPVNDTLDKNLFTWSTQGYQGGYFSYIMVWSYEDGLLWTSPKPSVPSFGSVAEDSFSVQLPSAMYPLKPGKYSFGAKVEFPGVNITTIIIRDFYAP